MSGFIDYSTRTRSRSASITKDEPVRPNQKEVQGANGSPVLGKAIGSSVERAKEEGEAMGDESRQGAELATQESESSGVIDDSSQSRPSEGAAPSSALSRSTSNESRFREDFDHERPAETRKEDGSKQLTKLSNGNSGSTLFKRRGSQSYRKPPPPLDRVTSNASTTRSQDSLQTASSRRIPSFAVARSPSFSSSNPTSPPRSPTVPSSPRTVASSSATSLSGKNSRTRSPGIGGSKSLANGGPTELTAQDRHYICRILTNSQFQREFSALSQIGTLSHYGDPFLPHANGPNSRPRELREQEGKGWFSFLGGGGVDKEREKEWAGFEWKDENVVDSPVCRYLYWRFIANMPALRTAKPTYWTDQIQPFFDSFAERDLSSTKERGEITKRRMLATGITRIIGSYLSSSIKPLGPSAPARPTLAMMNRVDLLVPGSMDSMWRLLHPQEAHPEHNAWVAIVEEKTRDGETVFRIVSRVLVVEGHPLFHALRSWSAIQQFSSSLSSLDPRNSFSLPLLPYASSSTPASRSSIQIYLRYVVIALSSPPQALLDSEILAEARQTLETFLLSGKDHISKSDLAEWVKRGEEQERIDEKRHRTWVSIGRRVKSLRTIWIKYRRALVEGDELDKTMKLVKKNSMVKMFPKKYREAEEWAKIWVAYALHYIFVGSSNGAEVLNILKGFHDLIPYGPIKMGLALVNPTLAIRAIVQLVLGQPAGQQSLFQRIWSIIVGTAIKHQKKLIEAYKKKLSRATIGEVLEKHVRASYVERQKTKQNAIENEEDIVLTIMRERGSGSDIELVDRWNEEFQQAVKAGTTGSTKFEDVKNLLAAFYRLRDREQVLAIALEPNTPRLLHASIAVFYDTIYKVANASKLSERVGDIQAFLDDLIKLSLSDKKGPSEFIKLADRHHEKLYYFVHELASNGGTLLDPLLDWCKSGLEFLNTGIPPSSDSSSPYKRAGIDVEGLLNHLPSTSASASSTVSTHSTMNKNEKDTITKEEVVEEARRFASWTKYKKVYHDLCLRIDLLEAELPSNEFAALGFDKEKMWQEFLAGDREAVRIKSMENGLKVNEAKARTDAGGDLEWAWWSAEELAGAAGAAKVSIALPSDSPMKSTTNGNGTAKLTRSKSARSRNKSEEFDMIGHDEVPKAEGKTRDEEEQLEIPAPEVKATKELLPRYLEQIKAALKEAKEKGIR